MAAAATTTAKTEPAASAASAAPDLSSSSLSRFDRNRAAGQAVLDTVGSLASKLWGGLKVVGQVAVAAIGAMADYKNYKDNGVGLLEVGAKLLSAARGMVTSLYTKVKDGVETFFSDRRKESINKLQSSTSSKLVKGIEKADLSAETKADLVEKTAERFMAIRQAVEKRISDGTLSRAEKKEIIAMLKATGKEISIDIDGAVKAAQEAEVAKKADGALEAQIKALQEQQKATAAANAKAAADLEASLKKLGTPAASASKAA